MAILNQQGGIGNVLTNALNGGTNSLDKAITSSNVNLPTFQQDGFTVSPIPNTDGNGLPSSKIPSQQFGKATRNLIHWFVPEVGIINMYVNPSSIVYNSSKIINKELTKGGFIISYHGEELTTLNISGNCGSSGVLGLNVLYEIYRSEQYTFDPIGLTMQASNSISGLNDTVDSALGNLSGLNNSIVNATSGLLGLDPASQNILPRNVPSLASLAMGIELYYSGWVFRGFFNSFNFTESTERLGIFDYQMVFTCIERRGTRYNFMPWHHSATEGPSNNNAPGGPTLSFIGSSNDVKNTIKR